MARIQIHNLSPEDLQLVGAEPVGAAAQAIANHKAESEPHAQYVLDVELESHINSTNNPHQVTRAQLGAEPAGAEERAKQYTDSKFAAIRKVTRSTTVPTSPSEGDIWEQVEVSSNSVMHTWIRQGSFWRSLYTNIRSYFFWVTSNADDLVLKRNWEIEIYPNSPFQVDSLTICTFQVGLNPYNVILDTTNYWSFLLFGTDNNNNENYWSQLDFKDNHPTFQRATKNIYIGATRALNTQLRRLRVEARATGNPGLTLARANLGYVFSRA